MKQILVVLLLLISVQANAQNRREKVPSYFGLQVRPVFPTRFIGEPSISVSNTDPEEIQISTALQQKLGYSFGATVRAGITKLIAFETGINYTRRNFDLQANVLDSNIMVESDMGFVDYDIPINALFYIRLSERWYMNTSLGVAVNFKPSDVGVLLNPITYHEFKITGLTRKKVGFDLNANVGFEFRTEKNGFFYLGGSGRVPFAPIFDLLVQYSYQGNEVVLVEPVDGSYLSIDFKYFFPNIKNKGDQPNKGPIE